MNSNLPTEDDAISATNKPIELSVSEAAVRILTERLAEVRQQIEELTAHDFVGTETVHRLRVASRRVVAGFDFFRDVVDPPFYRLATRSLKKLRSRLGQLRDLDVFIELLDRDASKGAKHVCKSLRRKHKRLMPAIRRHAGKIAEKLARLESRTPSIPLNDLPIQDAPKPFKAWALERIDGIARRFLKLLRRGERSAKSLHRLRIRAKKLRYSFELLTPAIPTIVDSSAFRLLQKLQTLLGEIQDGIVQRETLCNLSRELKRRSTDRFAREHVRMRQRKHTNLLHELERCLSADETNAFAEGLARLLKSDF